MKPIYRIRELSEDDRPREKLLRNGESSLSDSDLVAILLGSGSGGENVLDLSRRLLSDNSNSIGRLARLSLDDLMKYRGIGEAKAILLKAAFELGKRRRIESTKEQSVIRSSNDSYEFLRDKLEDLNHEEFWILYLNRANRIIDTFKLSQGGITGTVIDVRIIVKKALDKFASSLILAHNHPAGTLSPSQNDIAVTDKIYKACKFMDVTLLDHLIITASGYYSFSDEGNL